MASIPAVTPHVDHLAGEHGLLARVDRRAGGLLCPPLVAPHQAGHHQRHQDPSQRHLTGRHTGPQYKNIVTASSHQFRQISSAGELCEIQAHVCGGRRSWDNWRGRGHKGMIGSPFRSRSRGAHSPPEEPQKGVSGAGSAQCSPKFSRKPTKMGGIVES